MSDSNVDELELLLRDLDGRQSFSQNNVRKAQSQSVNYSELDGIISELTDKPGASVSVNHPARQSQQHSQQHYQPQQQHQQHGYQQPDNRSTIENLDDLLRGLEGGDRDSVAPVQQRNNNNNYNSSGSSNNNQSFSPTNNRVSVNNNYNSNSSSNQNYQPQQTNSRVSVNNNYNNNANASNLSSFSNAHAGANNGPRPNAYGNNINAAVSVGPKTTTANQKVYVAKPPQTRPIAGDDLHDLISKLTDGSAPTITSPSQKGSCASCGRAILGESISALGNVFHPEHFQCGNCREPIGTNNFFEQDGMPNCEKCYQQLLCARCAHCEEPITDKCVSAMGRKWHLHHFICTQCLNPFPGGSFFERDSRPFCESCFSGAFNPRCGGCNQPIKGEITNALGQSWHPEHFVCQTCEKAFTGSFFEFAGKPYCDIHYHQQTGAVCAGCSKAVTGKCIDALGKKWHPEHFICAFCMNPLAGGNFTENNNKAYCKHCHGKLFG